MKFATILIVLALFPQQLPGGMISGSIGLSAGGHGSVGSNVLNVLSPVDVGGGYTIGATACIVGYCNGEPGPGPGTLFSVPDPLTFRITSLTASCATPTGDPCTGLGILNMNNLF